MRSKLVTTNGMIILDDIETADGYHHTDVIGGAGTYAIISSSIIYPGGSEWIVDRGEDFPKEVTSRIEKWNSGAVFRDDPSRMTTRGSNVYGANDLRQFQYLTPKKQITVNDWVGCFGADNVAQLSCFHLVCSPSRVLEIFDDLLRVPGYHRGHATFVWEPLPDSMIPLNFEVVTKILNLDEDIVFSPNAEEAARLFGQDEPLDIEGCVALLQKFGTIMKSGNIGVLRCGKIGSIVLSSGPNREIHHSPAYHSLTQGQVIDPTGGGNAFLGGFCMAFALTRDLQISNICGSVTAGCAIEQIGPCEFDSTTGLINGSAAFPERLAHYLKSYNIALNAEEVCRQLSEIS